MKYKYIATEQSVDVRFFEILSDTPLTDEEIENALVLPDINVLGSTEVDEDIQSTYLYTEYGGDSQIGFHLQNPKPKLRII
tara:strand:+ start:2956 stop:3198 length:243 start_codon:yes stop_codon:yes gene_type:complete